MYGDSSEQEEKRNSKWPKIATIYLCQVERRSKSMWATHWANIIKYREKPPSICLSNSIFTLCIDTLRDFDSSLYNSKIMD